MRSARGATSFAAKPRTESRIITTSSSASHALCAPRWAATARPIARMRSSLAQARIVARVAAEPSVFSKSPSGSAKSSAAAASWPVSFAAVSPAYTAAWSTKSEASTPAAATSRAYSTIALAASASVAA